MTKLRQTLVAATLTLSSATAASGASDGYSGVVCNPDTPADGAKIGRSSHGVFNMSSSTANVSCGAAPPVSSNVTNIVANVYDRHATANVCCTMMVLDAYGNI